MEISTIIFEFLSFYKGDIGIPDFFVLLLGAFFIVKTVLARVYTSPEEAVSRPQRSAEEEASLLEAQEAVRRKIAAQTAHKPLDTSELLDMSRKPKLESLREALEGPSAPLSKSFLGARLKLVPPAECLKKLEDVGLRPKLEDCSPKAKPASLPSQLSRGQKALRDSLLLSRPKALE